MKTTTRFLGTVAVLALSLAPTAAWAQRDATQQAFERMDEALTPEVEEGSLSAQGIGPILLVGATPAFEETRAWFPVAAIETLTRIFGRGNIRVCEACLNPRVHIEDGRLEHNTVLSLPEIAGLDADLRGDGAPARSAVWVEETPGGIALRIIRIGNGQVLFAGNFDAGQTERVRTARMYNATLELGRRLRGESLTHIFIDAAVIPNQHISLDIAEQFGASNKNLAGITFSLFDPIVGVGAVYYRVIPAAWNLTVGAQVLLSVPTALVSVLPGSTPGTQLFDPIITGVLVARLPIPSTNFAVVAMASTSLRVMVGLSLMNVSFLPLSHDARPRRQGFLMFRAEGVLMNKNLLCLLVASAATLGSSCASRNYTYYLVEPEPERNPELSEDETLQRPFVAGSNTSMKVRWNDGDLLTEIDVPMLSSGQRIVIEHATDQTGVKPLPSTELVPPPPSAADNALVDAYKSRGLRVNDEAAAVSIHQANQRMKEAIQGGNYGLALEWCELVLARYPSHPQFLRAKASLLLLMGEREKAIEIYEMAETIESDPAVRKKLDELQSSEP